MPILSSKRLLISISTILVLWLVVGIYLQRHTGLADNGDYTRAMKLFTSGPIGFKSNWPSPGTQDWDKRFFHFWIPFWKLDWPLGTPTSSVVVLWWPGILANYIFYSREVLYLPVVSLFPKVMLGAGLLLLLLLFDLASIACLGLLVAFGLRIIPARTIRVK